MGDSVISTRNIPTHDLGGRGAPDPARCSAHAIAVLSDAAGADMRMTSLSIDVTTHGMDADVATLAVKIDKRARSIVFASCEARIGDKLVFAAQGLFSRIGPARET